MSAVRLLEDLRRAGVRLWLDGDRLRYRAPEAALGPDLLTRMAEHKPELAALLRRVPDAIRPAPRDRELPLSFNQQQLWLLAQLHPDSPVYHEAALLRLRGALRPEALRRALEEIFRRHEVLRTTFVSVAGRPLQVITPHLRPDLPLVDLAGLDPDRREAELERLASQESRWPFNLAAGPLLRLVLLRCAPHEHALVIVFHHLIHDGESMQVLGRELAALYEAFAYGSPSPLPELPIQYADYACWQRERLQGELVETAFTYWREQLAGAEPVLDLPLDRPRPLQPSFCGARVPLDLDGEIPGALRAVTGREGATLFMILLAGFFALLHRSADQDRINVGIPRSGRDRAQAQDLLGFIVDTQVLSVSLEGDPPFAALLGQVREKVLGAEAHADLPFELLVEKLQPRRDPAVNPLFQAMFAYQQDPRGAFRLPGLEVSLTELYSGTAKFDLDLSLVDAGERVDGFLEFSSDLFEVATARRIASHYRRLLAAVAEEPQRRLWDLPLLDAEESEQILVAWNDAREYPQDRCLHELFEEQADRAPGQPALSAGGRELTYGELDSLANRLAHALGGCGAGRGSRVAVLVEDGLYQAPALLAVLKAGSLFVCLDPRAPRARLAEILLEVAPAACVTESAALGSLEPLLERHRAKTGAALAVVPADRMGGGGDAPRLRTGGTPADPCYIAYTSGSTGRPKGIVQSHASFAQFLAWQSGLFAMRAPARIAQWAALSYDAAYCEIFGALCFGATLCVPAAEVKSDAGALLQWLRRERVSLLQVVPSFCRQLLLALDEEPAGATAAERLPDLERVLLAGEALPIDLARAWLARFPERPALFNLYGPSETVLATWHAVRSVDPSRFSVPVGRAIDGRQILVLDRAGGLCPVGVRGEVYVRSRHLTLGYFERPEETRRAFLQNPLHDGFPDPVYRTGDLGRWLGDGVLELWGRRDHQVKVRGMRVELGEVEAALAQLPGVRECAVAARDFAELDRRLVAYLVGDPPAAEVRRALRERLPDHMIPALFVRLEALPRTSTGKLDRRALPRPALERTSFEEEYVAPRSPLEFRIAACWSQVLQLDRVGAHDNFFSLGGSSLAAVQAMHRIADACGVSLPVRALWEAPTPAALAERVEAARGAARAEDELLRGLLVRVRQLSEMDIEALLALESGGTPAGTAHIDTTTSGQQAVERRRA